MRFISLFLILLACPKNPDKASYEERERLGALEELMQEEEFDGIPDENDSDTGSVE